MKQKILLFISINLVFASQALYSQDFSNPGDYMTAISNAQTEMNQKYMAYMSATAHVRRARKIDKMRQQALESIDNSRSKTIDLPIYKGTDNSLRQSSIEYIKFCYNIFNDDYAKILNMEDIAEQSFDEMQAFLLLQEKINEKLDEANGKMKSATDAFAKKYKVNLIETKNDLTEKLDESGKLNHYRNQLYLIYYKCFWEDGEIVKAMNAGKITESEQGRNSLIRFADEGILGLDSLKNFQGDPALAVTCREILKFYKRMAEDAMPKLMDYFLKKENFEKIKKSFEAKSESDRSKKDIDAFNNGVKEINKATDTFNATNKKIDGERKDATNKWDEADKTFAETHMPYYK
jgi:hypothetical protein